MNVYAAVTAAGEPPEWIAADLDELELLRRREILLRRPCGRCAGDALQDMKIGMRNHRHAIICMRCQAAYPVRTYNHREVFRWVPYRARRSAY